MLEFDIKGLFDNLPHDLLMKAVRKHVKCRNGDCTHWRWKVAARAHSIPNLIEVTLQIFLELLERLSAAELPASRQLDLAAELGWAAAARDGRIAVSRLCTLMLLSRS